MSSLKEKDLESSALQDQDAARPTLAHNNLKGPSLQDDPQTAPYPTFSGDIPWSQRSWLYEFTPFRGMYYDLKRRLPFYKDDWLDALHPENWYKITESTIRMYFINLMPALAYILDMYHRTHGAYGVNEVILASALAAIVFSVFSMQPLTFVGVTGLINLVNYTQYNIVVGYYGLSQMDYLRVQAWSLIWSAGFHFLAGIFNLCDYTRFITDMTSETFGFYVGIVYIQKGIELLLLEFEPLPLDNSTGWLSVTIAILFTVSVYLITSIGSTSYLPFKIRSFISSFAFTAGIIFWTGFSHFPKNSLERIPIERLPITKSFFPTMDRSWFIDFWNIEIRWVFVGAPLGFLITLLFYFDHNVSSVMAQARQFPVKKPAGFHWDFFLLGITTLVSGFLGLPAPNGLVPQAPVHTESLSVYQQVNKTTPIDEESSPSSKNSTKRPRYQAQHIVNTRVVEQRLSHFAIGLLTIATMTRPLLVVLGTMPRAVFAGVFILVGWGSIEGNGITRKTLAVFRDRRMGDPNDPLKVIRREKIALYVGIQWLFFALTIAISQTIAAIGFPVIITLLIPFRFYLVPKWFSPVELSILDAPTAEADVVLASLGHESERVTGKGVKIAKDTGCAGTEWKRGKDDDDDDSGYDDGLLDEYVERDEKSEAEKHHDRKATRFGFGLRKRAGGKDSSQSERDIEPATTNVASSTSGTAISSSPNETSNKTSFLTAGNQDQMVSADSSTPAQSSSAYPPSSDKLYPSIKSDPPSQESKSTASSAAPAVVAASALPLSGSFLASKAVGEDKEEKRREKEGKKKAKEENERLEKEKKLKEKEEKRKEKESKPGLLASLFSTPLTGNEENGSEKKEETNPTTEKPLPTPIPTATSTSYPPSSDKLYPTSTSIAKETSKSVPEVPSKEVETSTPTSSTKDAQSSTQKGGLFASLFKTPLMNEESKTKGSELTKREGQDVKAEASTSTSKDLEISAPTPISKDSTPRSSWPVPIATSTTGRASTSTTSTRPPVPSKDTPVKETPTSDSKEGPNEAPLSPRSKSRLIRVENPRRGPGIAPDPIQWRE